MVGYNGDDYPRTPALETPSSIRINGNILANAINKNVICNRSR